jgi:hypothetical protein
MRFSRMFSVLLGLLLISCGRPADSTLNDSPNCEIAQDILDRVKCLPGVVEATELPQTQDYREIVIQFSQPMDHFNPQSPMFKQKLHLLHRDEGVPMVLFATGYGLRARTGQAEITKTFGLNQLAVEHRYFQGSTPEQPDWTKLNVEQSANDFHRVTEAFKKIYDGKWLNTGHSKGGMTSVFHRRFFPEDLDGTVAYVAPLSLDIKDARYVDFLNEVGGPTYAQCRAALKQYQKTLLERRDRLAPTILGNFTTLGGKDEVLEAAALDVPFVFWQYGDPSSCATVPTANASDAQVMGFLEQVAPPSGYDDTPLSYYWAYFYQSANQLGYPGFETAGLETLLKYPEIQELDLYIPAQAGTVTYDPSAMADVGAWVKNDSSKMMFVYGEYDPWSAGKFQIPSDSTNISFTAPEGNHGADIYHLKVQDQTVALAKIRSWLGLPSLRRGWLDKVEQSEIPLERGSRF